MYNGELKHAGCKLTSLSNSLNSYQDGAIDQAYALQLTHNQYASYIDNK